MTVIVRVSKSFKTAAKPLLKKYPSLRNDLLKLEAELLRTPKLGTALGHNIYKIRVKISSKGRGKSGGARVISLVESALIAEVDMVGEHVTVNLLTIYDKSVAANISDRELKELIKSFYSGD